MTQLRLDKISVSSYHESFLNYSDSTTIITVSGSIPPGSTVFSAPITFLRSSTICDIFYSHSSIPGKRVFNTGVPLQRTDFLQPGRIIPNIRYTTDGAMIIVEVFNPGSSYTIPTQTYTIYLVQYSAPISL